MTLVQRPEMMNHLASYVGLGQREKRTDTETEECQEKQGAPISATANYACELPLLQFALYKVSPKMNFNTLLQYE